MSIYKKIQACRATIKASDLKKSGHNTYSNYDYYTPEQVDKLVYDACLGNGLFNKFELMRDANGLYGQITVIDLESKEEAVFIAATEMPSITATNASQQMGGCMTFAERYLKQTIYNIVDNNLDFDAHDNTKKAANKPIQPAGKADTAKPGTKTNSAPDPVVTKFYELVGKKDWPLFKGAVIKEYAKYGSKITEILKAAEKEIESAYNANKEAFLSGLPF